MDNDGILDIVSIINYMIPIKDAEGGYVTTKSILRLMKTSIKDAHEYITLDKIRTFCDESIMGEASGDTDDLMIGESKWMGYEGTEGDCHYD